jgi:peptide/nickel transport system substrate-binding protein
VDRFQLHTYQDHDALRKGFLSREVNAAAELTTSDVRTISDQLPATQVNSAPLYDGVYAFFKTDMTPVLSDAAVRRALVKATDRTSVRKALDGSASNLEGPLVPEQLAGIGDFKQAGFDSKAAASELEAAGWKAGADGVRQKGGQRLQLTVVAPRTGEFPDVLERLAKQWRSVGVDVRTQVVPTNTFEQNILTRRAYDVLLYEIALGADPDIFAYWHSTQASVRGFNLSNYKSGVADDALVSARGRSQVDLRTARYRTFIKTWLEDAPAVALYRPHLSYVTTDNTDAVDAANPVIDTLGRYHTIDQWTVTTDRLFKTP